MPTQINFNGDGGSYETPAADVAPVTHAQSNFDGGRTTKQGGKNKSRPQMNYDISSGVPFKAKTSHFGEKQLTGNDGGY